MKEFSSAKCNNKIFLLKHGNSSIANDQEGENDFSVLVNHRMTMNHEYYMAISQVSAILKCIKERIFSRSRP